MLCREPTNPTQPEGERQIQWILRWGTLQRWLLGTMWGWWEQDKHPRHLEARVPGLGARKMKGLVQQEINSVLTPLSLDG